MMNLERYDDEQARALRLFVILTRCFHSVAAHTHRDIVRHEFSSSEFGVLEMLYHNGATPQGELAKRILLTTGSLTYVVDKLVKQGLVERVGCPTDRRVWYADLTKAGYEKIAALFPAHAEVIRQTMAVLTPDEQETVTHLLKKLGLSAQAALMPCPAKQSKENAK